MISRTIEIDGRPVEFRASAAIPRLYRFKFRRDIMQDLAKLKKAYVANQLEGAEFETIDLELFENVTYIMAKHANSEIPNTIEEWLDDFNVFSIYEVMPTVIELWCLNEETLIDSKKKLNEVAGN